MDGCVSKPGLQTHVRMAGSCTVLPCVFSVRSLLRLYHRPVRTQPMLRSQRKWLSPTNTTARAAWKRSFHRWRGACEAPAPSMCVVVVCVGVVCLRKFESGIRAHTLISLEHTCVRGVCQIHRNACDSPSCNLSTSSASQTCRQRQQLVAHHAVTTSPSLPAETQ
jgi:hypothetical protein